MVSIIQSEHPTLRGIAEPVSASDFGSTQLKKIITNMRTALAGQRDGVAIAAPQIGVPLRIFVVAGFIFKKEDDPTLPHDRVFVNPEIIALSKQKRWLEEGCLSVRYLYGKVRRSTKAKVHAYDENGKAFTIGASGLLAQIFQHETDHLNGALFIDTAKDLHELTEEEREQYLGEEPTTQ